MKVKYLPETLCSYLSSWFFSYDIVDGERVFFGHKMAFDGKTIEHYLSKNGFHNIVFLAYDKSSSIFNGYDFERYKDCSLYVEAKK